MAQPPRKNWPVRLYQSIVVTDDTGAWFIRDVRGRITAGSTHLPSCNTRRQRLCSELTRQHLPTPGLSSTSCRTTLCTSHPYWQVYTHTILQSLNFVNYTLAWNLSWTITENKIKFIKSNDVEYVAFYGSEWRNWSTFDFMHTKKRYRLDCVTVKSSVKVHRSLRLVDNIIRIVISPQGTHNTRRQKWIKYKLLFVRSDTFAVVCILQ